MTQRERDRLVVLKKAQKKHITQRQAAEELKISERQVRRLLGKLKEVGDRAVVHGLRGRRSNRRLEEKLREKAVQILSEEVYRGFGPTLASEYLASKHKLRIGREALRQLMLQAGLWRQRLASQVEMHQWRARRSSRGELVQWDTSEHDWLEGRGEKLYLIHMIDDATSELTARFVRHGLDRGEHAHGVALPGAPRPAGGVLHRQGQHLSDRTPEESSLSRGVAADPDWAGADGVGDWLGSGALTAGQRTDRAQLFDGTGSFSQRTSGSWSEDSGSSQRVFRTAFYALVESTSGGPGCHCQRRPSPAGCFFTI